MGDATIDRDVFVWSPAPPEEAGIMLIIWGNDIPPLPPKFQAQHVCSLSSSEDLPAIVILACHNKQYGTFKVHFIFFLGDFARQTFLKNSLFFLGNFVTFLK